MSENKSLHSERRFRRDSGGTRPFGSSDEAVPGTEAAYRIAMQGLEALQSIINCGPAVAIRWRIADGWPVEFVSDNVQQFGYTADELMSGRVLWPSIIRSDDVPRVDAEIARYLEEGRTEFGQEYQVVTESGDLHWVEDRKVVVADSEGAPTHINGILLDVTERKRTAERLREQELELARMARLSDMCEMATGVAHELSEPLSAINNYVEGAVRRLQRGSLDSDSLMAVLGEIAAETERASETIHHLRHLVRKRKPLRSSADVNELVQATLLLVADEMRRGGVEVHLELQQNLPPVFVDIVQIRQCLWNLVRNALDAMREGPSHQGRLAVTSRLPAGNEIEIAVSDTGSGFVPDTSDRVFEPFFTTKEDGLGVGLSLAQSIVRAHGGRIWATPNPERGVTFKFTLPAGNPEE